MWVTIRNAPPVPSDWRREPIREGMNAAYRDRYKCADGLDEQFITTYTAAIIAALDAAEGKKA
jgi:hypothetical protein